MTFKLRRIYNSMHSSYTAVMPVQKKTRQMIARRRLFKA